MSVDSVGAYAAQTATDAANTASSMASSQASGIATPQLGENDFLSLLVAQMKDQDPTQPSDPTAFVSQLASFSEVSGMDSMQSSMSNLASSMLASQVASGTSLIGQQVIASTTTAALTTGGTVTGALNVPSTTTNLQVQVTDANGNAVSTFSVTPPSGGGATTFTWNGLASSGAAAPTGVYTFNVAAAGGGTSTTLTPMFASTVESVSVNPSTQALSINTNAGSVPLSSVVQVQ
ncbi:MAG TPA: flagellar hook capping FlgD N-terminal domain-containing protein [Steroidobacteraceae bacterium]|jgi:flagellar basal-body rod modification protein FlgD|nr:flagellar hook capping FlgD N-terminal domain-containing protein [Steroidobacteraceae bacterium]